MYAASDPASLPIRALRAEPTTVEPEDPEFEPVSVQALREMRGMSQIELATAAGLLPDHLRALEAGLEPTVPERQALAAVLDVPAESIA